MLAFILSLKLANYLLDDNLRIKIADFGLAIFHRDLIGKSTICGTPNYIAPETLKREPCSYPMDVWSLGVVIYYMLIGSPPF